MALLARLIIILVIEGVTKALGIQPSAKREVTQEIEHLAHVSDTAALWLVSDAFKTLRTWQDDVIPAFRIRTLVLFAWLVMTSMA